MGHGIAARTAEKEIAIRERTGLRFMLLPFGAPDEARLSRYAAEPYRPIITRRSGRLNPDGQAMIRFRCTEVGLRKRVSTDARMDFHAYGLLKLSVSLQSTDVSSIKCCSVAAWLAGPNTRLNETVEVCIMDSQEIFL